ncbi:MAG: hypothetical protein VB096_05945 [Pseudoflavonifractor sp.]|nr:hypothetical protein [Pseudoflavonifractor sp.]
MSAQWTGELVGKMHTSGITAKQVSAEAGLNPKYVSAVLNGRVTGKRAEAKLRAALSRLIESKKIDR